MDDEAISKRPKYFGGLDVFKVNNNFGAADQIWFCFNSFSNKIENLKLSTDQLLIEKQRGDIFVPLLLLQVKHNSESTDLVTLIMLSMLESG